MCVHRVFVWVPPRGIFSWTSPGNMAEQRDDKLLLYNYMFHVWKGIMPTAQVLSKNLNYTVLTLGWESLTATVQSLWWRCFTCSRHIRTPPTANDIVAFHKTPSFPRISSALSQTSLIRIFKSAYLAIRACTHFPVIIILCIPFPFFSIVWLPLSTCPSYIPRQYTCLWVITV